jgi:hypothetical protein
LLWHQYHTELWGSIVHIKDLPVIGFSSKDTKVGWGLWKWGPLVFVIEYLFYIVITTNTVPVTSLLFILVLGKFFHFLNINAGLEFKNEDIKRAYSIKYALLVLFMIAIFVIICSDTFRLK